MARTRANVTTDHEEIRRWAEERGASPACVRKTGGKGDIGMIRLDFPGYSGADSLEHIGWDEWFQKFDESGLALLHQDTLASGGKSNFNKLIARETANAREKGNYRASRRGLKATGRGRASGRSASTRSTSARAKRASASSERGEGAARTKRASSSRTKSSGASSRGREPGRAVSRSKSARGSQSARGDVTRRSGTTAGRNRGKATAGGNSRRAVASNTGRRSAKRNTGKVAKTARRIKQGAENIIRMERGQGSRGPSRATKRTSAKSARTTARSRGSSTGRRKAA